MTLLHKSTNSQGIVLRIQHILEILHKWGIHTLGEFASLDKAEVCARLGPEAVFLWERANGQSTRLLKLVQPPESFEESFEFEYEVETVEPLLFMLRRFLEQLSLRLHAVYFVAKELTLRIHFTNKQSYERRFKIPQPTNDVDLLFRMLHTHLADFKSEHPIMAVSLHAQPVKTAHQQFGLFETVLRDPNQLYETLARLTALLGADRVGMPVLEETYCPDAFSLEPFAWQVEAIDPFDSRSGQPLNRPVVSNQLSCAALRRFRPATSALVLLENDKPIHVWNADINGAVAAQSGPYVSSGNWWDEKTWARREWDLELENGVVCRSHARGEAWEFDGIYD
jgi:protein ImuB